MPYLDIIMPHHREPWETGKKFFDMLALQRGIDFRDVRVILVQDGEQGELDAGTLMKYPFAIIRATIRHQGVSAARNEGIEISSAEWLTFCDFDDMYSSALSLKVALEELKRASKEGLVYVWNRFLEEGHIPETGDYVVYKHIRDATFVHGRFIKREFLIDNGLKFNPRLSYGEDADFNTLAQILAGEDRIGEIKEPIYLWCQNADSVTRREKDKSVFYERALAHRFETAEELRRRGIDKEYTAAVVRTTLECYYELSSETAVENIKKQEGTFAAWWKDHRAVFNTAPAKTLGGIMNAVRAEKYGKGAFVVEKITLAEWLEQIEKKYGKNKG